MTEFRDIEDKDGFFITATLNDTAAATAANYGVLFTALKRGYEVMVVGEIHGTAGTNAGAVTLQLEKLTGTTAKGSGSNILVTAFDLKGTINTLVKKEGVELTGKTLAVGDRLAWKTSGTLTAVANVHITVYLKPLGRGSYTI